MRQTFACESNVRVVYVLASIGCFGLSPRQRSSISKPPGFLSNVQCPEKAGKNAPLVLRVWKRNSHTPTSAS